MITGTCAMGAIALALTALVAPENVIQPVSVSPQEATPELQSFEEVRGAPLQRGAAQLQIQRRTMSYMETARVHVHLQDPHLPISTSLTVGLLDGFTLLKTARREGLLATSQEEGPDGFVLQTSAVGNVYVAVLEDTLPPWCATLEAQWGRPRSWSGWKVFAELEIEAGDDVDVDLRLIPGGEIHVIAKDEKNQPLDDVRLSLLPTNFTAPSTRAETAEGGLALFKAVIPGDYILSSRTHKVNNRRFKPVRLHVEPGSTVREEIHLTFGAGELSGRLLNLEQRPLVGARVMLTVDEVHVARTQTEADGTFHFTDLLAGSAVLEVRAQELPVEVDLPAIIIVDPPLKELLQVGTVGSIDLGDYHLKTEEQKVIDVKLYGVGSLRKSELSAYISRLLPEDPTHRDLAKKLPHRLVITRDNTLRFRAPKEGLKRQLSFWDGKEMIASLNLSSASLTKQTVDLHQVD